MLARKNKIMEKLPQRKPNRLEYYDYSSCGVYFITICVKGKSCIFWENPTTIKIGDRIIFTEYGIVADKAINNIRKHYKNIKVDNYVIMPNHIHLLLSICGDECGRAMLAPTISTVIMQLKGYITKKVGFPIWQKSFHDRIIRSKAEYLKIWEYIENNPVNWQNDCFFRE